MRIGATLVTALNPTREFRFPQHCVSWHLLSDKTLNVYLRHEALPHFISLMSPRHGK